MVQALRQGYVALGHLQNAVSGSKEALKRSLELLDSAVLRAPRRPAKAPITSKRPKDTLSMQAANSHQKSELKETISSILDRPYPVVSGRRCVPHLVNTPGMVFLRYKKPQPQIINQLVISRYLGYIRRYDRTYTLEDLINLGKLEDNWDRMLKRNCGLKRADDGDVSWAAESCESLAGVLATVKRHAQRESRWTRELTKVRDEEKELAEQERAVRMVDKRRRREARRIPREQPAQSGENQTAIYRAIRYDRLK